MGDGSRVAFENGELAAGLHEGRTLTLLDLTVTRRDCEQDCTMWFVVRAAEPDAGKLVAPRIVYGQAPSGMAARTPAKPLAPGSYAIGGTVQRHDPTGALEKSIMLDGTFAIEQDASGKRHVRNAGR